MINNRTIGVASLLLGLALLLSLAWVPAGSAQDDPASIRLIRALESDETDLPNPAGLAFSNRTNAFYVAGAPAQGQAVPSSTDILTLTPFAERAGSARLAAQVRDPLNMAFDAKGQRLLILQTPANRLLEVPEAASGGLDVQAMTGRDVGRLGLQAPRGMSVDPASGRIYILDGAGPRLVVVEPQADGSLGQARVSVVELGAAGLGDVRGLAFDPSRGHLHVMSLADQGLYELSQTGEVIARRELGAYQLRNPQGMVVAPSGDQTDDGGEMSLYLADAGDGGAAGSIYEFSFSAPVAPAAIDFQSSIVRITDLAAVSPPSPDPSGLTYVPGTNKLIMSDGEVEETVRGITHWQGANVWELTLSGGVIRTANVSKKYPGGVQMTDEPAGIAWNANNGHFFFSSDGMKEVFDLNPGSDGLIGTGDDSWTSFDTLGVGNGDPEGIAVDTLNDRLFVADGVNREVYQYTLAGSLVGHFDVQAFGVQDPESVEFNPNSGTLYVMSSDINTPIIVETTLGGSLLQTINISATNARQAAGLAIAPASNGGGAKRFYIVDRGIDNDDDPNIVDGKMFEMTTPNLPPVAVNDDLVTNEDTDLDFAAEDLLANDYDPEGSPVSIDAIEAISDKGGTITDLAGSAYRYSPPKDFSGTDTFDYTITDGEETDTATVSVQVNSGNDPPVAVADNLVTNEDTDLDFQANDLLANDYDPEGSPVRIKAIDAVSTEGGTITDLAGPAYRYSPPKDFNGTDTFTYTITDGAKTDMAIVSVQVISRNDPPVALDKSTRTVEDTAVAITLEAIDVDNDPLTFKVVAAPLHGTLSGAAPALIYTPDTNYVGPDSFTFKAKDGKVFSNVATVTITVTPDTGSSEVFLPMIRKGSK